MDLIDRQAAKRELYRMLHDCFWADDEEQDAVAVTLDNLPSAQPEPCEYTVSAMAVEEMLKDLLPKGSMREIEGDEAKTVICETVHDALEGLWKLPFVKPNSKELSLTQKALDVPDICVGDMISRQAAIDFIDAGHFCNPNEPRWSDNEVVNFLKSRPSAQPELIETAAYIRGFEQGRTQGMIDSQGGEEMNKQRKVLITITYNEMGIIIDTKAEEVAQPNLQPTCNQLATDCISRQAAIDGGGGK